MPELKKKVCIVSTDAILVYQPSVLNLYDALSPHFDVTIVTFPLVHIAAGAPSPTSRNVHFLPRTDQSWIFYRRLQQTANFFTKRISRLFPSFKFRFHFAKSRDLQMIRTFLRAQSFDHYIGVDADGFYAFQQLGRKGYFFSLELNPADQYISKIRQENILGIIIQSQARLDHLFPHTTRPVFFIQNAPTYQPLPEVPFSDRKQLVYAGTMVKEFGIYEILNFIRAYPTHSVLLKGGVLPKTDAHIREEYAREIARGSIVLDKTYIEKEDFTAWLSRFRIGFCFYDWDLIRNNFNYYSAPSGKLYAYLAAGVPVIAPDIEGMSAVREFDAGVLVKDYHPETLLSAVKTIEERYAHFAAGAIRAAMHYSFDRMSAPFVAHLRSV